MSKGNIGFLRSYTPGKKPTKEILKPGNLAVNFSDQIIYCSDDSGGIWPMGYGKSVLTINGKSPDSSGNLTLQIEAGSSVKYDAGVLIKDKSKSSAEMNELIKKVQKEGGGTIVLGEHEYIIDGVVPDNGDGYKTGWLVPYTPEQGQFNTKGVTFELSSGSSLVSGDEKIIMIRGSNNFTRINGSGRFTAGNKETIHVGFVPENMIQTTQKVSQQFCSVDKNIGFLGGYSAVTFQPGPTVDGAASGSFFHRVGFTYFNVSYPVWFKAPPKGTKDVLTTTTYLEHIYGHFSISSGKFEACDAHLTNCAFEGMSGEAVEYVEKGNAESSFTNKLMIDNCDFEAYATSNSFNLWGITLGPNNKFVSMTGTSVELASTLSPNVQYGKQVYGSYDAVIVREHVIEQVAGKKGVDEQKIATIINKDGFSVYSVGTPYIFNTPSVWFNCPITLKKGNTELGGKDDLYSGLRTVIGDSWNGVHIRCNSGESKKTNQVGVRVEFNGARKGFHPFQYIRDGVETFMITDGGDMWCAKGSFLAPDIHGIRINGDKDFSAFVHVPPNSDAAEWTTSFRCYGNEDWRIGEKKIVTDAPKDNNNYVRNNNSWVKLEAETKVNSVNGISPDVNGDIKIVIPEPKPTLPISVWEHRTITWVTCDKNLVAAYSESLSDTLNCLCTSVTIPTKDMVKTDYQGSDLYVLDILELTNTMTANSGHDNVVPDITTFGGKVRDIIVELTKLQEEISEKPQFVLVTNPENDTQAVKDRNDYIRLLGSYFGCCVVSLDRTCGLWNTELVTAWSKTRELNVTITETIASKINGLFPTKADAERLRRWNDKNQWNDPDTWRDTE